MSRQRSAHLWLLLADIDVQRIEVDTDSRSAADGRVDLVVTAVGKNGERLEVSRNSISEEGMIGESTPGGFLTEVTSWLPLGEGYESVEVRCPKCCEAHPGIECDKVQIVRLGEPVVSPLEDLEEDPHDAPELDVGDDDPDPDPVH